MPGPLTSAKSGVSDVAYDATSWDGVTTIAPSKNAVRDKIESMAHSGGVIGTATFDSNGGVASLVITGIISGVTYDGTGIYLVTFTSAQSDAGYIVNASGYDAAIVNAVAAFPASKTVNGFTLHSFRAADAAAHDPASIEFSILRLSQ